MNLKFLFIQRTVTSSDGERSVSVKNFNWFRIIYALFSPPRRPRSARAAQVIISFFLFARALLRCWGFFGAPARRVSALRSGSNHLDGKLKQRRVQRAFNEESKNALDEESSFFISRLSASPFS